MASIHSKCPRCAGAVSDGSNVVRGGLAGPHTAAQCKARAQAQVQWLAATEYSVHTGQQTAEYWQRQWAKTSAQQRQLTMTVRRANPALAELVAAADKAQA